MRYLKFIFYIFISHYLKFTNVFANDVYFDLIITYTLRCIIIIIIIIEYNFKATPPVSHLPGFSITVSDIYYKD